MQEIPDRGSMREVPCWRFRTRGSMRAFPGSKTHNDRARNKKCAPNGHEHSTAERAFQAAPTGRLGLYARFPRVPLRFTLGYSPALPTGGSITEAPDRGNQTGAPNGRFHADGSSRQRIPDRGYLQKVPWRMFSYFFRPAFTNKIAGQRCAVRRFG